MRFFDTHAHYTDSRFNEEFEGGVHALLNEVFSSDVQYIVNVGTDVDNSYAVCEMAKNYPYMYAAAGIHPSDCIKFPNPCDELDRLSSLLENRKELKIVALGEIGLDYYWDDDHHDLQKEYFHGQIELAQKFDLPIVIHDREAHGDCFDIVTQYKNIRGVFHSFSGSAEMASELLKRGWYISFSGVVSFKNAKKVRQVAEIVPSDRILIETDCPYLTPEPYRGKLNRSDYLKYTLSALALAKNVDAEELSEQIFQNSLHFFDI